MFFIKSIFNEIFYKPQLNPQRPQTEIIKRTLKNDISLLTNSEKILYDKLRQFRLEQSNIQQLPAYKIFNNATLYQLCVFKPKTCSELYEIYGFAEYKVRLYGPKIIKIMSEYNGHSQRIN